jgi:hypothetical protein
MYTKASSYSAPDQTQPGLRHLMRPRWHRTIPGIISKSYILSDPNYGRGDEAHSVSEVPSQLTLSHNVRHVEVLRLVDCVWVHVHCSAYIGRCLVVMAKSHSCSSQWSAVEHHQVSSKSKHFGPQGEEGARARYVIHVGIHQPGSPKLGRHNYPEILQYAKLIQVSNTT